MSEEWRRKAFYHTRVLIPVDEVLESAFGDCLVCLTGGQLNLVRNLLQYADRRSTFVSEYHERFYLAPTTEEWDALQAVVADLERNLMNCEEWSLMLEQVLLQGSSLYGSPATGAVIWPYVEEGTLGPEDPYWDDLETEDPRRCAIAQLTWHIAKDLLEEEVQPAQMAALDAVFPIAIAALLVMMGVTVVTMPIAAVYLVVRALVMIWAEGELANVLDELDTAKHDLVCAVYVGLETSYADAASAAALVLDNIAGLSPVDKVSLKAAFAPWAMAVAAKGYDNGSAWAVANVVPGYCADCPVPGTLVWEWSMPPHTGWTLTATNAGWTVGDWAWWKQGNGGIVSPHLGTIPYGDYTWSCAEHVKGSAANPDHAVVIRQVDDPAHFWSGPVWDVYELMDAPTGAWANMQAGGTITISHPYAYLHITGRPNDTVGCEGDYWKLTLVPV